MSAFWITLLFIFRQFAQTLMIEALIEAIAIASAGLPLPPASAHPDRTGAQQ
jgi:hypothetical protein